MVENEQEIIDATRRESIYGHRREVERGEETIGLCLPADFNGSRVRLYGEISRRYKGGIREMYGNLKPGFLFGSGQGPHNDSLPQIDHEALAQYVCLLHEQGIAFNYTLNSSCNSNSELSRDGRREILSFLDGLVQIGVDSVTVATPALLELIRDNYASLEVCASVIFGADSLQKALYLERMGAKRIVVLEDENRNFELLASMVKHCQASIELIVNPKCAFQCPFRHSHFNSLAHDDAQESYNADYYTDFCESLPFDNFLKIRWIRPEDLTYYREIGIEDFKIAGRRDVSRADLLRVAEAYLAQRFEGNFVELYRIFSQEKYDYNIPNRALKGFIDFFRGTSPSCRQDCGGECNFCSRFLHNILDSLSTQRHRHDSDLELKKRLPSY